MLNHVKFVATKKGLTTHFSPPLFSCCFWIRDLGLRFWIQNKPIPDHGSRGQITTGFRIHNTGLFSFYFQDKASYLKLFSILLENGHGMQEDHE
jgi:hypothetical protein